MTIAPSKFSEQLQIIRGSLRGINNVADALDALGMEKAANGLDDSVRLIQKCIKELDNLYSQDLHDECEESQRNVANVFIALLDRSRKEIT